MKKILVPIDFSSVSDDGLLVAKKLARITSAKIHIYHVMERSDIDEDAPDMEDLSENGVSSIAKLDALVHKRIDQLKIDNYQIHYELGFRSVYRSIIDKSEEINADLIVIGAFGVEGPQKFIGSNAERVIRMSSIPVLSIRGAVEDFYPTNMVFASQFLNEANMAYEKLKPFIKAHCSTVNLLRVVTPSHFERSSVLMALMNKFGFENKIKPFTSNVSTDFTVEDGIKNFAQEVGADIIAVTVNRNRRLNEIIGYRSPGSVINSCTKAVLSVRISDESQEISNEFQENYKQYISEAYYEALGTWTI